MTTQDKSEVSGAEPSEPGFHDGSNHDDLGSISRKIRKPLLHHDYVFLLSVLERPTQRSRPDRGPYVRYAKKKSLLVKDSSCTLLSAP
ncbi:hypothetical protein DPMN_134275 [Dreissena polymorpha]|uniref:Uncharacterized protein n=1 Tax=Dreissena polymorpha TaxID=45954 RepID=A0A9D4FZU3_DREPO|nr:hypothetical protein DPMN_134275 [Dreissena polymorpha]